MGRGDEDEEEVELETAAGRVETNEIRAGLVCWMRAVEKEFDKVFTSDSSPSVALTSCREKQSKKRRMDSNPIIRE